jgi:hypothetical protein
MDVFDLRAFHTHNGDLACVGAGKTQAGLGGIQSDQQPNLGDRR